MNGKAELLEQENNPNYESEQAEQAELKKQYDAQEKTRQIDAAIKLLQANGFLVTIGG